ncbi:MAG: glycosyltransferase family 4 protein [Phycisphaerales bacterium]
MTTSDSTLAKRPPRRVYHLAGPGDVIGTFRRWLADAGGDEREVSRTYSAQFFDVVTAHGLTALVEASRAREAGVEGRGIRVMARPQIGRRWRGPLWDVAMVLNAARILWTAVRFRADTLVVGAGTRWYMLIPAALLGIRVVPILHNTLWAEGVPPPRRGLRDRLTGLFWRRFAAGTVAISPAAKRQVESLASGTRGEILVATPQYDRGQFEGIAQPEHARRPFVVMYAGRLERDKGVFDLLEAAERVEAVAPGQVLWELCGDGRARGELEAAVERSVVRGRFVLHGHRNRDEMRAAFERSHVVVVPTRSSFPEGFNQVVAEGVLSGRPVVTSAVVPAIELVPEAVVLVPPDEAKGYAEAVLRLLGDRDEYERLRSAAAGYREQFFDRERSWARMLERVLGLPARVVPVESEAGDSTPGSEASRAA